MATLFIKLRSHLDRRTFEQWRWQRHQNSKTNKARTVPLTRTLQQLLLSRRANDFQPDDLIFTSTNGCAIDSKNFCKRYWKPALAELGIDCRRPYTTRHTLISHGLESGMNPVAVAALTGHVRTLYHNYAGLVNPPRLPDLLPVLNPVSGEHPAF